MKGLISVLMLVLSLQARSGEGGACRVKGVNDICTHASTHPAGQVRGRRGLQGEGG